MNITTLILSCLILMVSGLFETEKKTVGIISDIQGEVTVITVKGKKFKAEFWQSLYPGDRLITSKNTVCLVETNLDHKVILTEKSEINLLSSNNMKVIKGEIFCKIYNKSLFMVETPSCICSGDKEVNLKVKDNGTTEVIILKGEAQIWNPNLSSENKITLAKGDKSIIGIELNPGETIRLSEDDFPKVPAVESIVEQDIEGMIKNIIETEFPPEIKVPQRIEMETIFYPEPPEPVALKPNIYLYPEKIQDISIKIGTGSPEEVTESIPQYNNGWTVTVTPEGLIDNTYEYLFYEGPVNGNIDESQGWSINKEDVAGFFTQKLNEYGFNQKETADFIDYWTIHLPISEYYNIYPLTTSRLQVIFPLFTTPVPNSLLRLWFVIESTDRIKSLEEPNIASFNRDGFVVTEWGVILK